MAIHDPHVHKERRPAVQNGTGRLYAAVMVVLTAIIGLALLGPIPGPNLLDLNKGPMTVEAVLSPTPLSEPIPVTEPRPKN